MTKFRLIFVFLRQTFRLRPESLPENRKFGKSVCLQRRPTKAAPDPDTFTTVGRVASEGVRQSPLRTVKGRCAA